MPIRVNISTLILIELIRIDRTLSNTFACHIWTIPRISSTNISLRLFCGNFLPSSHKPGLASMNICIYPALHILEARFLVHLPSPRSIRVIFREHALSLLKQHFALSKDSLIDLHAFLLIRRNLVLQLSRRLLNVPMQALEIVHIREFVLAAHLLIQVLLLLDQLDVPLLEGQFEAQGFQLCGDLRLVLH